jgi:hypothetical protein
MEVQASGLGRSLQNPMSPLSKDLYIIRSIWSNLWELASFFHPLSFHCRLLVGGSGHWTLSRAKTLIGGNITPMDYLWEMAISIDPFA